MTVRVATGADFDKCLALRFAVFVDEQNVPIELERDEYDDTALHLLGEIGGVPMGTARIVFHDDYAKVAASA